jgi:hypothetical protein
MKQRNGKKTISTPRGAFQCFTDPSNSLNELKLIQLRAEDEINKKRWTFTTSARVQRCACHPAAGTFIVPAVNIRRLIGLTALPGDQ